MSRAPLRLAVVEVTRRRPHAPRYDAYVQTMVAQVLADAGEGGWAADRLSAGDLGVDDLLRLSDAADAIVVLGGEDIAPEFYGGGSGYVAEGSHDVVADAAQIALVRRAIGRGTPLLGICRGHQIINVALGGTLVQHLDDAHGLHRAADVPADRSMVGHDVAIEPGSGLAAALGVGARVRSAHHQAVGRLGDGLSVVARSSDGTVEAVEHRSAPVTGVQWHPEDRGSDRAQLPALLGRLRAAVASVRAVAHAA